MKRCCRCKEERPLAEFKRSKATKDGFHPECKTCRKARYEANREQNLAYRRRYYEENREAQLAYAKKYGRTERAQESQRRLREARAGRLPENPTPGELRARDWYLAYQTKNRDRLLERSRQWYETNREAYNAYARQKQAEYRQNNPGWNSAQIQKRKARKLGNGGTFTAEQWQTLKARFEHTCLRCGKREPEITLQPDHVVPLTRGGSNGIENIQPLCGSCNCRKYAKHIDYRPHP